MRRKQNQYSWIAIIAISIAILLVIILILTFKPQWNYPIEIKESLMPTSVKENEPAKLICTINNVNGTSHEIQFIFATENRIEIYAGNDALISNKIFNFTIGAYERDQVREFTILGSLEENVASSTYQIQLQVSIDNQIIPELTRNIYLTVTA